MGVLRSSRWIQVAFVAGATTIFLLTLLAIQQFETSRWERSVQRDLAASNQRSAALRDYLSSLTDIETGQRGFLVTADAAYLQPFERALERLPAQRALIRSLDWKDSERAALAKQLLMVGDARMNRAIVTVSTMKGGDRREATERVLEGTGKRLMDQARALVASLEQSEVRNTRALVDRTTDERANLQRGIYMTELAALLSLSVLLLALIRIVRDQRRTAAILSDSDARQRAVVAGANDGILMLDGRGLIESVNPAAEAMFGRIEADMVGRSILHLFRDPPSEEASQAYLRRLAGGDARDNRRIFAGLRGDGTTIEAEVVTTPIHLEDGLHFLAVARDATQRRQVEAMKDEFVATVSHELRTPLTSVAGSLGLILGGAAGDVGEKATRLVQIAYNNCNRLIRLINDMLDIEKIESGKVRLDLQPIDLATAIEQATTSLSVFASDHGVTIASDPAPKACKVVADGDRLTQIITNLVSNAVKFSPAGETVRLSSTSAGDRSVRVSVTNVGPGIPDEFRDRIFQKFAQADSTDSRQKGGTGLGLSIVRELVERMGGTVGFDSVPDDETTFWFELPAVDCHVSANPVAASLGRMEGDTSLALLHVDDDTDMLRLVASAFEGRAIVHSAPSLEDARAAIARFQFDAIVLDVAMPDGNGLDLLPFLESRNRGAPVVVYSALDDIDEDLPGHVIRLTKSKVGLGELVSAVEVAIAKEDAAR